VPSGAAKARWVRTSSGYVIDREPTDVLWVMPSREAMADFLKDELEPMIRANPSLERKSAWADNRAMSEKVWKTDRSSL